MPVERFYIPQDFTSGCTVLLSGDEWHHMIHVVRIRQQEQVELVNGQGALAQAELQATLPSSCQLKILSVHQEPKPEFLIFLGVPLLRPSKLEWILEKGTELGAHAFWIYPDLRSSKTSLSPSQSTRCQNILIAAMKQCGRLHLPLLELKNFEELFQEDRAYLFGDPGAPNTLAQEPLDSPSVLFITGAEGGFTPTQKQLLLEKARGVRLNRYTLKAETAPLAALALLSQKEPF